MKTNGDLCSLSIDDFHPHYSDIRENYMIYSNQRNAIQYFKDLLSSVSIPCILSEKLKISDLEKLIDQASAFLHDNERIKAKVIFKALPHLYSYFDFKKANTNKLKQVLIQIHNEFPEKSFIIYPLLILLILEDKVQLEYDFLFYHLLSIPKYLLKPSLSIFLNEESRFIDKCFILSTFIPSFEFAIQDLVCPSDHYLLPDPIHMVNYLPQFTEEQIKYACHLMQICHHYLLSITQTEELSIECFTPLLRLIGSSSFSRSCFSLSLYIITQIPSENSIIIQFIQKVQEFGCLTFIDELFLYNTSESFSYLIPISSNIFYQFFITNFESFSSEMKTVITSFCHDLNESAEYLKELSINSGNRVYLFWLYIFLTRLNSNQEEDEVKFTIVHKYWSIIQSHIQKVYALLISAEKFKDPSISFLLNSALYSIFNYLLIIVKEGQINDLSFINQIYDFVYQSLHFIISVPIVINKVTSLGCVLKKTYSCIQKLLAKQPLFFKRCCLTFSDADFAQSPVIALAMSNIRVPITFISKLANLLILADEPTCFYCLSSLIGNCQKLNELSISLIQFFHNLVFLKKLRKPELQKRVLMRYFLLLCSEILDNGKFARALVTSPHFGAFDHLLRKFIDQTVSTKDTIELQESIVFFLWSLYHAFAESDSQKGHFSYFEPYPIEIFQRNIQLFTENGANALLEAIVDLAKVHHFETIPFTIHFNNINHSPAQNIQWFTETVMNMNKSEDLGQNERLSLGCSFSLPWKQNCVYSSLLSSSNWGVEFQKLSMKKAV